MRRNIAGRLGFSALGVGLVLSLGTLSAVAAPVTDRITGTGTSGSLPSGASWSLQGGGMTTGGSYFDDSYFGLNEGNIATLQFSEPVTVEFSVASLAGPADGIGTECVTLPVGVQPISFSPNHTYNSATRAVCGRNPDGNQPGSVSRFRVVNTTSISVQGSGGNAIMGRGVGDFDVTVEREEAVLVDDSDSTTVDTPVTVDIRTNDSIPTGSTGWTVDTTTAQGGTVVDNGDGTITYTPPAGVTGTDTFTYRVTGPDGVEVEATVTITVTKDVPPPEPMIAPGMAAVALLGAGLLTAIRRRRAA